jgi:hypothetical protein
MHYVKLFIMHTFILIMIHIIGKIWIIWIIFYYYYSTSECGWCEATKICSIKTDPNPKDTCPSGFLFKELGRPCITEPDLMMDLDLLVNSDL